MSGAAWFHWDGPDLILMTRVQPRAARNALAGVERDSLKIRLTAPPVEGRANKALTDFLAELFDVPKSRVILERGERGRCKRVRICAPKRLPSGLNLAP